MRYPIFNYPCDFEIRDEWLAESGMNGFSPTARAYLSDRKAPCIPLHDIEPPFRSPGVKKDWCGFDRARMVCILKGFVAGDRIPPVSLRTLPETLDSPSPYRFRVHDGYHRFYASLAAGFDLLPSCHT